jgi:UDP-glucose 4-epimerase
MKVVVTGSRGYIGTATKELLEDSGYEVIEIDKKIGRNTIYLFKYIVGKKPICIIHLSAKKSIPESKKKPMSYYLNNILSTISVGMTSRVFGIPVAFASSAAVYELSNPYAKSKKIEEFILKTLSSNLVILRYFNIVGKTSTVSDNQSTNIFSIIEREQSVLVNSTTSTRDYVHVLDIARANILAMQYLQNNDYLITDIFTGEQRTVMDILSEYKNNNHVVEYQILNINDASISPHLDNRDKLGWMPVYTFKQAIQSEIKY